MVCMYDAPSKRDAYGVGGVLTPNSFILFTAKAAPTFFDVGVKFISRVSCVLCDVQDAPSKRDAYVDVGVKFISREEIKA
ncbi:MAG: hypothetical protein ACPGRR_08330 [Pseudoalteromonas shioyasakiensis]